jgi:hypothetical protein
MIRIGRVVILLLTLACLKCQAFIGIQNQPPTLAARQTTSRPIPTYPGGRLLPRSSDSLTRREMVLPPAVAAVIPESISALAKSLFSYNGNVPVVQAALLNIFGFAVLQSKLKKMLTPEGMVHACALGIGLWATLGWRGWTLCVAYLILGQAVTKVRFAEKEKRGIAESRGGRRGPENVW